MDSQESVGRSFAQLVIDVGDLLGVPSPELDAIRSDHPGVAHEGGADQSWNLTGLLNTYLKAAFRDRALALNSSADQVSAPEQVIAAARLIAGEPPNPETLGLAAAYLLTELRIDIHHQTRAGYGNFTSFRLHALAKRLRSEFMAADSDERLLALATQAQALNDEYRTYRRQQHGDVDRTLFVFAATRRSELPWMFPGAHSDDVPSTLRHLVAARLTKWYEEDGRCLRDPDEVREIVRHFDDLIQHCRHQVDILAFHFQHFARMVAQDPQAPALAVASRLPSTYDPLAVIAATRRMVLTEKEGALVITFDPTSLPEETTE